MLKRLLPLLIFTLVFIIHILYFKLANFGCFSGNTDWFSSYMRLQEYYMGFSYAISLSFAVFAFMKFRECKGKAIGAGVGAGAWAIALWTMGCFLAGCCGSPMWIVYVNLLGISALKVPKWSLATMSLVMVILWLRKKLPKYCSTNTGK